MPERDRLTPVTQNSEVVMSGFTKLLGVLLKPLMKKMAAKNAADAFSKLKLLAEADRS